MYYGVKVFFFPLRHVTNVVYMRTSLRCVVWTVTEIGPLGQTVNSWNDAGVLVFDFYSNSVDDAPFLCGYFVSLFF